MTNRHERTEPKSSFWKWYLFFLPHIIGGREVAVLVGLVQTDATDGPLVALAEKLLYLAVFRAEVLGEVSEWISELVGTEHGVLQMRTHMLRAVGCHARQASFHCLNLHARVAQNGLWFVASHQHFEIRSTGAGASFGLEGFHHGTEHGVLFELRLGREVSTAVRAVVRAGISPRLVKTEQAETVSTVQTHGVLEWTQADAAGQISLQAQ